MLIFVGALTCVGVVLEDTCGRVTECPKVTPAWATAKSWLRWSHAILVNLIGAQSDGRCKTFRVIAQIN